MFLYICLNAIYVYAMPPENMKGVISIGGLAMKSLFGVTMEIVFSLFIAFALLSSLSAFIILGPRVYYAMAQQGHFFRFVSRIHPVFHVPSKAIWLQAFLAVFMALSGTFDQILTYMGFSLGIFPILAVLGVIKLRHRPKRNAMFPGYPFIPIFYAVASSAMLILAFFERPVESSIAMATVVAGIPLFFVFQKRGR
jgi:APA family basic amino acid/polyamine antiporter